MRALRPAVKIWDRLRRVQFNEFQGRRQVAVRNGLIVGLLTCTACGGPEPQSPVETDRRAGEESATGPLAQEAPNGQPTSKAARALSRVDFSTLETSQWVRAYDPERSAGGYTLAFYKRRVPLLLDMNGRIVHLWRNVRGMTRARLYPDGSLLTFERGGTISRFSWDGERLDHWPLENITPHHDLRLLPNGNLLVVTRRKGVPTDEILEITPQNETVWTWEAGEHLRDFLDRTEGPETDITHINSVQLLPENRHFDAGDERFRPGNLLISVRNLSTIFVIERRSGVVAWSYTGTLDYQHEALMAAKDQPSPGNVFLLDNGFHNRERYRSSRVLELDPATEEVVWEYTAPGFYTSESGLQQLLPNGNLLISSSRGGRVFEIDRDGRIVWQWTPPYEPRRPQRFPRDFCPQMSELPPTELAAVIPGPTDAYLDRELYEFERPTELRQLEFEDGLRQLLPANATCRRLMLPLDATLSVRYGIDSQKLEKAAQRGASVTFRARLESAAGSSQLLIDELSAQTEQWIERKADLSSHALEWVELCVEAIVESQPQLATEDFAFWYNPKIKPPGPETATEEDDDLTEMTPEELAVRREHLKTLGYVD